MLTKRRALPCFSVFALVLAACGGRVSLGDDNGANALLAGEGVDAGGSPDVAAATTPVEWPTNLAGLDGGLDYPEAGQFNELVWQRWWDCGGATCAQEMWINADCTVFWNDRGKGPATGTLDASDCADIASTLVSFDLPTAFGEAAVSYRASSPTGGEVFQYHTGGPGGPWYRARTEGAVTVGTIGGLRKMVIVGTRAIAGATEHDPQLP